MRMRKEQVAALAERKVIAQRTIREAGDSGTLRAVLALIDCCEEEAKEMAANCPVDTVLAAQGAIAAMRQLYVAITQPVRPERDPEKRRGYPV